VRWARRPAAHGPRRDLGITHQAILHHFGSREDLLAELARSVIASLGQELITALDREEGPPAGPTDLLDRVFQAFGERGQARLIAWLALSGLTPTPSRRAAKTEASQVLLRLAEVLHSRWGKTARGASFENTQFTIVLGSLAVFGDAITGAAVRHSAASPTSRHQSAFSRMAVGLLVARRR
jgi:AcrR family transcriptional regulator